MSMLKMMEKMNAKPKAESTVDPLDDASAINEKPTNALAPQPSFQKSAQAVKDLLAQQQLSLTNNS